MVPFKFAHHPVYKYELTEDYKHVLANWVPFAAATTDWLALKGRELTIRRGYAWDGASGPAIDTVDFLKSSMVHDALYQLIALGLLPRKPWKAHADLELYRLCREDGMSRMRAAWVYAAVRTFGRARRA